MFQLQPPLFLAQMNTSGGPPPTTASAAAQPAPAPVTPTTPTTPTTPSAPPATGTAATATAPGTQPAATPSNPFGSLGTFLPIILMFVVLYFVLFRGQRKEEKRRKELIAEIKKGDKVMTIGGMLASVVSVDDDKVVLKIDESNNIKATYRKSAIQEVIDRDEKK